MKIYDTIAQSVLCLNLLCHNKAPDRVLHINNINNALFFKLEYLWQNMQREEETIEHKYDLNNQVN